MSGALPPLGWTGIVRLGLVQTALGAIIVLTTSTMNRVMVVELALPAMLPGLLVALHHTVQMLRPRMGYGSDVGGRRTPWILGGMAVLALGGVLASLATAWMSQTTTGGIALAIVAFLMIGIGVGAAGTSLLVLLAKRVDERRRAAAASIVWAMMIAGFVVTAGVAGHFLDPYSPARLVLVTSVVAGAAFLLATVAVAGLEGRAPSPRSSSSSQRVAMPPFREALAQVWSEPQSRLFTIFVFVSMLAFSAQDLILEPFAGTVFGLTPGQSTQLSGVQNAGVLLGMVLVAFACSARGRGRFGSVAAWRVGGCIASALALFGLASAGFVGPDWPLKPSVFALGLANGAFAVAAIGSMMALAGTGRQSREGVRMGLWGAAQAVAFAAGGVVGTAAVDLMRWLVGSPLIAYATVFAAEAILFLIAAQLAAQVGRDAPRTRQLRSDAVAVQRYVAEPGSP
ncbi:MAG TPA: BCD family MFS transporter [Steroidobacteraceae bacterium]|nr:BCD family MFS transporter [Steroidobacteraceae bacterium]